MRSPVFTITFIILCHLSMIPATHAEQFVHWQGFDIHYNTFSSLLIPPEVAKAHEISRSRYSIVTNISIVQDGKPTTANVTGQSLNLIGQLTQLEFVEVNESTGIYYLANQVVDEKDTLRFSIRVKPSGSEETYNLNYNREYY